MSCFQFLHKTYYPEGKYRMCTAQCTAGIQLKIGITRCCAADCEIEKSFRWCV